MQLELRQDFTQVRQRWAAFWHGDRLARPMLIITAPHPQPALKPWPYPVRPDLPPGPQIDDALSSLRDRLYLGDAAPSFMLEFGAEHFATFVGADMKYPPGIHGNGWIRPFVQSWDDFEIRLRRDGIGWQRTVEYIRAWRARCDGVFMVNAPVLSANLDVLAAIRGNEGLLTDLLDCPDKVHRALAQVRNVYAEVVDELGRELSWDTLGSCNWTGMYCPGRTNTIQCDFSCMISSEMFQEFAVPNLRHEASHYQGVAYHLDGPQAAHHLPAIVAVPGIEVIQYVPVPSESPEHVEAVYRQALALGKGIIRSADLSTAHMLWEEFRGARMIFHMCVNSPADAEVALASFD
jgi:hypothetical protein